MVTKRCIVKDCTNSSHPETGGEFIGDLCSPCHQYITTGEGVWSQAYRNAKGEKENLTQEDADEYWVNSRRIIGKLGKGEPLEEHERFDVCQAIGVTQGVVSERVRKKG